MQRLFSTFPNSWPGLGLLLLRCAIALSLPLTPMWQDDTSHWIVAIRATSLVFSGLLIAGAWTPIGAIAACVYELTQILFDRAFGPTALLHATLAIAIGLLGPGAWSVDAIMYGRKRIDLGIQDPDDGSS